VDVADRDRESVGGVQGNAAPLAGKESEHHGADLRLFRLPVTDERLLHQAGLVLENGDLVPGGGGQQNAAGVRELYGRGDVLSREDGLDGDGDGMELGEESEELVREKGELRGEEELLRRAPDAAALEGEPAALEDDGAVAGGGEAGVETEDDHDEVPGFRYPVPGIGGCFFVYSSDPTPDTGYLTPGRYPSSKSKFAHTF
jgi:hypothetical protein